MNRCFYFGVWKPSGSGHSLWAPDWRSAFHVERDAGRDSRRTEHYDEYRSSSISYSPTNRHPILPSASRSASSCST